MALSITASPCQIRLVADGYDDYAERTFIWGGTKCKLRDDVRFVIDPEGNRYIENMAIVRDGDDNFDFNGSDRITNFGNVALEHAIDPSGIGSEVKLAFDDYDPEGCIYTEIDFLAELTKEQGWSQPSLSELQSAM